jgi:hypothetical protein
MQFRSARKMVHSVLFTLIALAALSVSVANEKPPLPHELTFEHGDAVYRIDYSNFFLNRAEFAREGGCYKIAISRLADSFAVDAGSLYQGAVQRIRITGAEATTPDGGWQPVLVRTTCLDDRGLSITDAAGPDLFELYIPKQALMMESSLGADGLLATVALNGHVEELDLAILNQVATGVAAGVLPTGIENRKEFINLASNYSAGGWYHRALPIFQALQKTVAAQFQVPAMEGPVPNSCWKPCTMCGVSAVGTIVGGTALAATCATTFGATCVGGTVGLVRLAAGTVVSCSECRDCRRGGGGGGGQNCSEGFSPCCEEMCCRDGEPPPDCGPEGTGE